MQRCDFRLKPNLMENQDCLIRKFQLMRFFNLITAILLILLIVACDKNDNEPENTTGLNGDYKGIFIWKDTQEGTSGTLVSFDTFGLQFTIDDDEFSDGPCSGVIEQLAPNSLSFQSTACDCWCGCDPRLDCAGHWVLGEHDYSFDGDSLKMSHIFSNMVYWPNGDSTLYTVESIYLLKKS